MLLKTMFRRSKTFMELGYHLRALNDISFCLRTQINLTGNANNVLTIYWEVRKKTISTVRDIDRGLSRVHCIPYRAQYQYMYAYSPQYSLDFSYFTTWENLLLNIQTFYICNHFLYSHDQHACLACKAKTN